MRIRLDGVLPSNFPERDRLAKEAKRFKDFQNRVVGMALITVFKEVCFGVGGENIVVEEVCEYPNGPNKIGRCSLEDGRVFSLWAGNRIQTRLMTIPGSEGDFIIWLGQKLAWKIYTYAEGNWRLCQEGGKAENSIRQIDELIRHRR